MKSMGESIHRLPALKGLDIHVQESYETFFTSITIKRKCTIYISIMVTGADNNNLSFITFIKCNTQTSEWPIYPRIGAYSQITTLSFTPYVHLNYNTLYIFNCIPLCSHTCTTSTSIHINNLKRTTQAHAPHMCSPPKRGKPHSYLRACPNDSRTDRHHRRETGPVLQYPLQHHSATRNRAPDKSHRTSERTGTT